MEVVVVEALPDILGNTLDADMSDIVFKEINENIKIITNHLVLKVNENEGHICSIDVKDNKSNEILKIKTDILLSV